MNLFGLARLQVKPASMNGQSSYYSLATAPSCFGFDSLSSRMRGGGGMQEVNPGLPAGSMVASAPGLPEGSMVASAVAPVAVPVEAMQLMIVTCPDGVQAGGHIQVNLPDGRATYVVVPAGVGPGQQFQVQVPNAGAAVQPAQPVVLGAWLSPTAQTPTGEPGFKPAKERTRGTNANPVERNYVFGTGAAGDGYYHISTQEAQKILLKRVSGKLQVAKQKKNCCACFAVTSVVCCPLLWLGCVEPANEEIKRLEGMKAMLEAGSTARTPQEWQQSPHYDARYCDNTGMFMVGGVVMLAAACGAGTFVGGGCGGGGCGGGGCGGGGCGGGGCGGGGGGCGGGGCGG